MSIGIFHDTRWNILRTMMVLEIGMYELMRNHFPHVLSVLHSIGRHHAGLLRHQTQSQHAPVLMALVAHRDVLVREANEAAAKMYGMRKQA